MIGVPEETIPNPKTEKIVFSGKMIGSFKEIKSRVDKIPFYSSKLEEKQLTIVRVESRNIRKAPYLFYIIIIRDDSITVIYSLPYDASGSMRRAQILKDLAGLISVTADHYFVNEGAFFQYVDSVLDSILSGLSKEYSTLFNNYESLLNEYRETKKLNIELSSSNRNLTVDASHLSQENKILGDKLGKLQKYSDEYLMAAIEDWLEVHNSTIDINEFSKAYDIISTRVEEILDKMVSTGYLQLKE